jgi:hypothetical protein
MPTARSTCPDGEKAKAPIPFSIGEENLCSWVKEFGSQTRMLGLRPTSPVATKSPDLLTAKAVISSLCPIWNDWLKSSLFNVIPTAAA